MNRFWMTGLLLAASSISASAQVAEFGVGGGAFTLSDKNLGGAYSLDDGWSLIFRLTINNWNFMGQEFGYGYNRTGLVYLGQSQGMAIHHGFYNFLVYATPEGSRIRPFGTVGGHFANYVPPGSSATYGGGENKFGVNYGGGVKVRVTENWLIRVDFRQFNNGKPFQDQLFGPGGWIRQNQFSAGLSFAL